MACIVVSNIPHYHHLAEGLHRARLLRRYITSIALTDGSSPPRFVGRYWQDKLRGRMLRNVPGSFVRQIRLPEVLQRTLPMARIVSHERSNWINNHLFDIMAERYVDDCAALHFVSSVGRRCASRAKRNGALIICDVRQEHPAFQTRMLTEEAARFGVAPEVTGCTYEQQVLDEFALADYIIVPSRHARQTFLDERFPSERVITLPYGVDLEHFSPSESHDARFRVLYAGRLTLRKGLQYLLQAWSQARIPGGELTLAGPLDPDFHSVLAQYAGTYRYIGAVPKVELRRYYTQSTVFVLPSLADSFSLATLEAMACGTPVIVSEYTGAADCIQDGVHGYIVRARDSDAIRERLDEFAADRARSRSMGYAAAERAREYTWERYSSSALKLYADFGIG